MYNVLYTPKSEQNLIEIFWYISEDNRFHTAKVITSIKNTIGILKLFPYSWYNLDKYTCMIVESTYKYKIIYNIKWKNIYILSIFKCKNLFN